MVRTALWVRERLSCCVYSGVGPALVRVRCTPLLMAAYCLGSWTHGSRTLLSRTPVSRTPGFKVLHAP